MSARPPTLHSGDRIDRSRRPQAIIHRPAAPASSRGDDRAKVDMSGPDVTVEIALGAGAASATIRTTDLSHAYVHENSAYST